MNLGWDDRWNELRGDRDAVRIAAEHRGAYSGIGDGGTAWLELPGRTFHRAADKRELPTVGDWVIVDRWREALAENGAAVIREILPRNSLLVRKAAGEATTPQPLAANVDIAIVMTSANTDISVPRLDRYLTLLRDGGIAPVLVLSKTDLVADPAPLLATLRALAEPAIATSTTARIGIDEIRALAGPGRTLMLLGSSGVGKSSLLNALVGTEQLTQPIREDDRGRHTTTRRELFVTEHGLWIDTPGLRELAQFVDDDDDPVFDDIDALAQSCRFRDCRHKDEPGCAVRLTVEPARLASFHKLVAERSDAKTRGAAAQRIAESRKAKAKKSTEP
ncbi:MAG TPA: ribosome small subunit-dependent GTPase A [Kofleriaceae bacterium]|nr:ribosome small subunit-dependent GTPase A [Kofleriaceae bacterium]